MPTTTSSSIIPTLWMIEANSTYRGWFVGGNQTGEWGNTRVRRRRTSRAAARSATFFATLLEGHASRWATARRSATCCTATPDDPVAAGLGRHVRARLGWTQDDLRSSDDRGRYASRPSASSSSRCRCRAGMTRDAHRAHDLRRPHARGRRTNDGRRCGSASRRATRRCGRYVIRSDCRRRSTAQSGQFTAVPPPSERSAGPPRCIPTGGSTIPIPPPPRASMPARRASAAGATRSCATSPLACAAAPVAP